MRSATAPMHLLRRKTLKNGLSRRCPNSLENSFDTNGKLITDFSGQSATPNALALQPDSKVVLLSTTFTDVASSFALARYLLE